MSNLYRNLTEGVIEDVFFPRGVSVMTGKMRLLRAPFQLLTFQTEDGAREVFVQPMSLIEAPTQAYASDIATEADAMARDDFGYYSGEFQVIEESELGDHEGNARNWRGFHSFTQI